MTQERFHVRIEGTLPIRLTVAEMTPDEALGAVEFQERELQLMQAAAAPAVALLQRVADGDRSMTRRELRDAREMVAIAGAGAAGSVTFRAVCSASRGLNVLIMRAA